MIKMFKFLTGILEKEEKKTWKILTVLSFLSPIMDIFSFSVILYIINAMHDNKASIELIIFTFSMGALSILKGFFEIYKCKISSRFIYKGAQKLSVKIYELQIKEDLKYHNEKSAIQAVELVRNDTEKCIEIIVSCIGIWINILSVMEYFVVLIYVSRWVGVVSCIVLLIFIILMFFQYRLQMKTYGEKRRKYAIKTNAQITIAYGVFKEMKIGNRSDDVILGRYQDVSRKYAQVQSDYQYKNSIVSMIMQNLVMSALFIVLALLLCSPLENMVFVISSMVVYITVLVKIIPVAYSIVSGLNQVEFSKKSYEVLKECLLRYDKIKEEEKEAEKIRQKQLTFHKGLSVRNLTFEYNEQSPIFKNAAIDIPAGYSVAVIGVSGAGKTTFLDLVLGLLRPQEGDILYDDYNVVSQSDIQGRCKANLGDIVSYIPQTVYLNGETIRDNVAFFEKESKIDNKKVEECLKCVQIWEDVTRMPEGIHTLIGENGTAISGGQRQRIALARALYKDFELLVMDEATAALDMETEKAVIDSIREMKGKKTMLMATHHMSLADECDYIYKIENQKIVKVK